ncbi:glycoside hydrolase [Auriculariales sp. MPI-PUGE-AT-0066]|nr:glycoside hydrolase [Auriculariales sp. MPI-PUGE-AT-0066]
MPSFTPLVFAATFATAALALNNGVGKLPVLGYNTWNAFQCSISETLLLDTAQILKDKGLLAAGYSWVNIDDCYSEKNRSAAGDIVASAAKFPSGMKSLTDKIHALGFKTGIYSDSGWFTCGGYPVSPRSYSNELRDARTFKSWGFDYLKCVSFPYDNVTHTGIIGRYAAMADAIARVAKETKTAPILYSLCNWGWSQVWQWGKRYGQSWRTTGDINREWPSLAAIINFNSFLTASTDFYGRNDLDMLQIGNGGLSHEESKSHFTAWALMKSPLLIGTDMRVVTDETVEILTNKEILAINQDPVVGESISPFRWGVNADWTYDPQHPAGYWSGETQNGTVIMLLNTLDEPTDMSFNLTESPWIRAGRQYHVRDLWTHTNNGTAVRNFTAKAVPAHGVVALLLKDAGNEPGNVWPPCSVWWQCTAQDGTRVPGS